MRGEQRTDSIRARAGVVTLAIVAVAGVPSAAALPARERSPVATGAPAATVPPSSAAPTPTPESAPAPPGAAAPPAFWNVDTSGRLSCTTESLPSPAALREAMVAAVDPTGRYVVERAVGPGPSTVAIVRRDGKPSWFTVPGPPTAVNASGVVVGRGYGHGPGWIRLGGRLSDLAVPDGFDVAEPVAVNADGDVVGTAGPKLGSYEGRRIVLWSADDPDTPQVLAGWTTTEAVGFGPDGTVIGNVGGDDMAYRWDREGSPQPLPMPAGWTRSKAALVRGDLAFGTTQMSRGGNDWGIVWNLSAGTIDMWNHLPQAHVIRTGNAEGWFVSGDLVIGPDRTTNSLPVPAELPDAVPDALQDSRDVTRDIHWISADGTRLIGNVMVRSGMNAWSGSVVWECG